MHTSEQSIKPPTISVVIITCNERHLLTDCVSSVRILADEIIVCDMYSEDGSADLARDLGCTVIQHPRMAAPDPEARTALISAAHGEWVLIFDPDMRLSPQTCSRLREISGRDEADAVKFHCDNYFLGNRCLHGHGSQGYFLKFFKKSAFTPKCTNIHTFTKESVTGRILQLGKEHGIEHQGYRDLKSMVESLSRYALHEAEQLRACQKRASTWRIVIAPLRSFCANYVWRRGFQDGLTGFIVSFWVAAYRFLTEAYVWDLQRLEQSHRDAHNA